MTHLSEQFIAQAYKRLLQLRNCLEIDQYHINSATYIIFAYNIKQHGNVLSARIVAYMQLFMD